MSNNYVTMVSTLPPRTFPTSQYCHFPSCLTISASEEQILQNDKQFWVKIRIVLLAIFLKNKNSSLFSRQCNRVFSIEINGLLTVGCYRNRGRGRKGRAGAGLNTHLRLFCDTYF